MLLFIEWAREAVKRATSKKWGVQGGKNEEEWMKRIEESKYDVLQSNLLETSFMLSKKRTKNHMN